MSELTLEIIRATSQLVMPADTSGPDGCLAGTLLGVASTPRTRLVSNSDKFVIPHKGWFVHDAAQTALPTTSAADDLGFYPGATYGTNSPLIRTYDVKNAGAVTLYARQFVPIPGNWVDGETLQLVLFAGMLTTVASVSGTLDVSAHRVSGSASNVGADLVSTAAIDINGNTTFAARTFDITATTLDPGDLLDVRVAIAINDSGTVTEVAAGFGNAWLVASVKG